jgi:hypothetical protein
VASPYAGLQPEQWLSRTDELIGKLPITEDEIVDVVLKCWEDIFASAIGKYKIGVKICPTPQIMGALLHELIPLELSELKKNQWRVNQTKEEKDLFCITNPSLSIEIKTSSHKTKIAGNRSYAQKSDKPISKKPQKEKSGYYLTVNFGKFTADPKTKTMNKPVITQIALGWIDHDDWKGQAAATGQSASISSEVYEYKLKKLYPKGKTS